MIIVASNDIMKVMVSGKKHVLIISPFATPNVGGVETHLDKLMSVVTAKGYYVTLITYQPLTTDIEWEKHSKGDNYEVFRIKWFGLGMFPRLEKYFPIVFLYLFPGIFVKSLVYYLKNYKNIQCIHAHGLAAATVAAILKSLHETNIVLSTHAIYSFESRRVLSFFVRRILKKFDFILGVSEMSKKEIIELGISKSKVGVHENWVDVDKFKPHNKHVCRKKLGIGSGLHVLFVGRFIEPKGIKLICESAQALPNVHFHLVGQGPLKSYVEDTTGALENVTYYGVLMQSNKEEFEKLLNLYSACDYVLSPYLYDEGFSATLVESVCCGTPVIVTDRGSPPTFLPKDSTLFISREATCKKVVDLLRTLRTDDKKLGKMQKECRKYALENFSSKNADVILTHY